MDTTLRRDEAADVVDRVSALVYRASLAIVLLDGQQADALLADVRGTALDAATRDRLAEVLDNAAELELVRRSESGR